MLGMSANDGDLKVLESLHIHKKTALNNMQRAYSLQTVRLLLINFLL